jgi:hypothetical protein
MEVMIFLIESSEIESEEDHIEADWLWVSLKIWFTVLVILFGPAVIGNYAVADSLTICNMYKAN